VYFTSDRCDNHGNRARQSLQLSPSTRSLRTLNSSNAFDCSFGVQMCY
jgi:hypothetical protein